MCVLVWYAQGQLSVLVVQCKTFEVSSIDCFTAQQLDVIHMTCNVSGVNVNTMRGEMFVSSRGVLNGVTTLSKK